MTRVPAVMIQGAGSNVGKSTLVAGLARAYARRGMAVRPFKPQNMSNNAAATLDGGEIGRAQALQAMAAGVPASVHMNPVLLKPETDTGAQVIVQGRRFATLRAREYGRRKSELLPQVLESFSLVGRDADLVLIEGAGSPAEINLRDGDIANMGFAEAGDVPVVLVGDIDRGGVIASLVGTREVLAEGDRDRIKAFIVNKFRGDPSLFADGVTAIEDRTGWRSLGVVPHFADAHKLPAEDVLDLRRGACSTDDGEEHRVRIAVPVISRIANFDDLDPLRLEPGVQLDLVAPGRPIPRDVDLILLPGSKSTVADLEGLRAEGWDIDILAHVRHGGWVVGLCGGYQMLGRAVSDPDGLEGRPGSHEGLGLLDVTTELVGEKKVRPVSGRERNTGLAVSGYEIHLGRTTGPDTARCWLDIDGTREGARDRTGRVYGAYVHGLFGEDGFRASFLSRIRQGAGGRMAYGVLVDDVLDRLADHLEEALDLELLLAIAEERCSR